MTEAAATAASVDISAEVSLSKRQSKKRKKEEQWSLKKEELRTTRRERQRERNAKRKAEGKPTKGSARKKLKRKETDQPPPTQLIAIDMSFDHLMNDKDIKNLVRQIERCYACNRRTTKPFHMMLTGLSGRSLERLEEGVEGYRNWKNVTFEGRAFGDVFEKDCVVYLAAESDNVLAELDSTKVYIIGGFVDHNHHKGLSFGQAVAGGFSHARLPIDEHVKLSSRKVLTVNHVYEALVAFAETGDWHKSFLSAIPHRKGVETRSTVNRDSHSADRYIDSKVVCHLESSASL